MISRLQWEVGQAQRSDLSGDDTFRSVTETASGGVAVMTTLYTAQELHVPN